ncbi:extracellular solute-binding protein [Deinococcus detaillensis]|uniref:extracellular solute-binding protein n=1 Tax=Deinococcus detaillensis TaxID=2592048 RepID=UPI00163DC093|nr:extracellular solute-binding protein [Deinococcus detaillensis]
MTGILAWLGTAQALVQVEFWHIFSDAPRRQWMLDRAAEFHRLHPEIKVTPVSYANYPQTFQALATAARTGTAPALVQISEAGTQLAIDSTLFRPLPAAAGRQVQDMLPSVLNYYRVGGQLYGLPFNTSSPVLYANTSLLRKAGITADHLPDTLEALTTTCATLKRTARSVDCLTFPVDAWYFEQWAAQQGALWVDGGNGRQGRATQTFLTSEAVARPLRWLGQMKRSGYYVNTGKLEDNTGVTQLFLSGRVAFLMTSSSRIGQVLSGSKAKNFTVQVGQMPVPQGSPRQGLVVGGSSLWIPREIAPEKAKAAQAFALYLTSTANLASWHRISGYDPLRRSSLELLQRQGWFRVGEAHTVAVEQFRRTRSTPATAGALFGSFYEVRAVLHAAIERVLGGAEVGASLRVAKARADEIIRAYNARL